MNKFNTAFLQKQFTKAIIQRASEYKATMTEDRERSISIPVLIQDKGKINKLTDVQHRDHNHYRQENPKSLNQS